MYMHNPLCGVWMDSGNCYKVTIQKKGSKKPAVYLMIFIGVYSKGRSNLVKGDYYTLEFEMTHKEYMFDATDFVEVVPMYNLNDGL